MDPNTVQTDALLIQARVGDPAAINDLLERHRTSLRRMVELRLDRQLARRVDASDVVQDVMLEANTRLEDYLRDPKMPFSLWLRHLARDRMIDLHRRHRESQRRSMDREQQWRATDRQASGSRLDPVQQLPDAQLTPAAESMRRELGERFLVALDQLEEDDRDILLMRHFEQMGNTEVAQMLGLSPAATGMRHLRALRRLRQILGDSPSRIS